MNKGIIYALLAALLNASVGLFSTSAFAVGATPVNVAFFKCLLAFGVLSVWVISIPELRRQCIALKPHMHKIALMALCGMFILYYFETTAYQFSTIAITVFILQGTSTITTFIASMILLKARYGKREWICMALAITGLIFLYQSTNVFSEWNVGTGFATIAGMGYGLFLVLNKRISLPFQGVPLLWWLLLFGSLFLLIPFWAMEPILPTLQGWLYIGCLGSLGTIGGFYFTLEALRLLSASKVQIYELCEPVFAAALGLLFFGQWFTPLDLIGAVFILTAIYLLNKEPELINVTPITRENE